ncbi:hypothetical protein [Solimonas soli]|uniref:hypothetical protein n=1 Tax=Solimonas soli TaxID=413479 RepID=UPI0012F8A9E2|nr:hypothetical protein [Solimonas soli]
MLQIRRVAAQARYRHAKRARDAGEARTGGCRHPAPGEIFGPPIPADAVRRRPRLSGAPLAVERDIADIDAGESSRDPRFSRHEKRASSRT